MNVIVRKYEDRDLPEMKDIWNEVVEAGNAFPQTESLEGDDTNKFFSAQSYVGVAENVQTNSIVGLYILHPNNVGRCGHICNASYAVASKFRGNHIGEKLVCDCMMNARKIGFKILQFNAVVKSNYSALSLYKKLGFTQLGVIPKGFRISEDKYEDIIPHFIEL